MVESICLYQLIQFLMSDETAVKQRLFVDSTSAKFVVQRSGVGRLKHVSIKHMFLQQLLRQKVFSIHKVPTRINPADLSTKKLSLERRNLLSSLCGLFPHVSPEREGDEVLFSRRVHRQVTARIVQALRGLSVTLLQGCTSPVAGEELQQGQALRGGRALQAPEQGYGWYVFYKEYKVYFTVVVLVFILVAMAMCTMYVSWQETRTATWWTSWRRWSKQFVETYWWIWWPRRWWSYKKVENNEQRPRSTSRRCGCYFTPEVGINVCYGSRGQLHSSRNGHTVWNQADVEASVRCCSEPWRRLLLRHQGCPGLFGWAWELQGEGTTQRRGETGRRPTWTFTWGKWRPRSTPTTKIPWTTPKHCMGIRCCGLKRWCTVRHLDLKPLQEEANPHTPFNETAGDSEEGREDSRDSRGRGEGSQERIRRYQNASLSEVSSPGMWQSLHRFESSSTEEWTRMKVNPQ